MIIGNFENCRTLAEFYQQASYFYAERYGISHLDYYKTIESLAKQIESYKELGSMQGVSAAAAIIGNPNLKFIEMIDITFKHLKKHKNLFLEFEGRLVFTQSDSTKCKINKVDMTFIDSLHKYKHLKKELQLHAPETKKFLMFHDTNLRGIKKAITELVNTSNWNYKIVNENGCGFIVLERKI
jgi:hypothetical protein